MYSECGNAPISLLIKMLASRSKLLWLSTVTKVQIAGIITTIANKVATLEMSLRFWELAYLSIGNLSTFNTKKVASAIKMALMVKRYIAPRKYSQLAFANP